MLRAPLTSYNLNSSLHGNKDLENLPLSVNDARLLVTLGGLRLPPGFEPLWIGRSMWEAPVGCMNPSMEEAVLAVESWAS